MSDWIIPAISGLVMAGFTFAVLLQGRRRASTGWRFEHDSRQSAFLFDEEGVIDRSGRAWKEVSTWQDLHDRLSTSFPGFPAHASLVEDAGQLSFKPRGQCDFGEVRCEWIDGICRVELRHKDRDEDANSSPQTTADLSLQRAMDQAPYPVWHMDTDGRVRWSNRSYETLAHHIRGDTVSADTSLFPFRQDQTVDGKRSRVSITAPTGDRKLWYDLSCVAQDDGHLCYAIDVNAVVDAEVAQRNFVQTLAKTFAQLPIGLAIFDRNRQLALFNPALIDLTALSAQFLSGRPSLSSFFDRLRNQNMMPEPKNYGGWRQQMNALVEAAVDGRYEETWTLPSGSVYSVNGRPHPDGAIGFLFQDITAEITLTRRFRSELELGQLVLDMLDDAVTVFSSDGTLTMSNKAYRDLWDVDPEGSFAQVSILDSMRVWQECSDPTPIWGDIRDFVTSGDIRTEWAGRFELKDGRRMNCIVSPIVNNASLIRFVEVQPAQHAHALEGKEANEPA
ncbi:PAS-domain containing protein [Lutimaribacter marinistellae]|uniref:PAS-domain containing protein n=1 Tax=Lutimaribacter marinistellae TaxID=1820329 RepID=A0ABV7TDU9_9RHOB